MNQFGLIHMVGFSNYTNCNCVWILNFSTDKLLVGLIPHLDHDCTFILKLHSVAFTSILPWDAISVISTHRLCVNYKVNSNLDWFGNSFRSWMYFFQSKFSIIKKRGGGGSLRESWYGFSLGESFASSYNRKGCWMNRELIFSAIKFQNFWGSISKAGQSGKSCGLC